MVSITYFERVVKEALKGSGNDCDDLLVSLPQSGITLSDAPPVIQTLWNAALCDVEASLVETEDGEIFFGGSEEEGGGISNRHLSVAGILGLNRLFPEYMKVGLKYVRDVRLSLGWRVCEEEKVGDLLAPWNLESLDRLSFIEKYGIDSIVENTDDVVWMWAAHDLFSNYLEASEEDWLWLYEVGKACFDQIYSYFYDDVDELYCGQAFGVTIHRPGHLSDGYPAKWSLEENVHCHSTATNALYVKAFDVMADAAERCGFSGDAPAWRAKAELLRQSILDEMCHEEGTMGYYLDSVGKLSMQRHALGAAFSVLHGVVSGAEATAQLSTFPYDKVGVPLLHPAFNSEDRFYNHTVWPYASTFFFMAREASRGSQEVTANAVAVARSFMEGSFHERMDYRSGRVLGGGQNLCSAASWINVCLRAGLTPGS